MLFRTVLRILEGIDRMSTALDDATTDLTAKLDNLETVQARVLALLDNVKNQLDAALSGDEPDVDAIKALSARLDNDADAAAAAVVKDTPSAQEVQPVPDSAVAPGTTTTDTGMAAAAAPVAPAS